MIHYYAMLSDNTLVYVGEFGTYEEARDEAELGWGNSIIHVAPAAEWREFVQNANKTLRGD